MSKTAREVLDAAFRNCYEDRDVVREATDALLASLDAAGFVIVPKDAAFDSGDVANPYAFIQWKGTNVCMDFHCDCGAHCHFDGDFAYTTVDNLDAGLQRFGVPAIEPGDKLARIKISEMPALQRSVGDALHRVSAQGRRKNISVLERHNPKLLDPDEEHVDDNGKPPSLAQEPKP